MALIPDDPRFVGRVGQCGRSLKLREPFSDAMFKITPLPVFRWGHAARVR